jgi:threonine aldolase
MRRAMAEAEVGDVCWGDDPTVARLEAVVADRLGKETALFVPSGTLANQLGLAVQTRPGDAVLCEARAHIAWWEGAAAAALSGLQLVPVAAPDGLPSVAALESAVWPEHPKAPRLRLLSLENTHNAVGGVPHPARAIAERASWAESRGLGVHLDGARLYNAAAATGDRPAELAAPAVTVSLCLSKGLGAPVGSLWCGPRALREEADRLRHRWGAGWRQAGILAAAGLYALEHHVGRLVDDHARAARLAETLSRTGIARPVPQELRTNLVVAEVDPSWGSPGDLVAALAARGVLCAASGGHTVRLVTHLDVGDAELARAILALESL